MAKAPQPKTDDPVQDQNLAEQTDEANLAKTGMDQPEVEQTDEANRKFADNGCTPVIDQYGNKSWPPVGSRN